MTSNRTSITVSDGFFDAYLAVPPSGSGPGILLIQEIFGINEHIRQEADRWAAKGFVVLAPDLFWRLKPNLELGYGEEDFQKALDYYRRFDEEKGLADLRESAEFLRDYKLCTGRIASLGFCLGGKLSFRLASCFNLNAAVCYYGVSIEDHLDEANNIRCKTLLHFAELDRFVPPASFEKIKKELEERPNFEIQLYSGVDHGFNCDARESYNEAASHQARLRSEELLKAELGLRS